MHPIARLALASTFVASAASPVLAQTSATLAHDLTTALTERHLDAFAAHDPAGDDRFVAALAYPGVQLLVVSARYPMPAELQPLVDRGNYRDIYLALQSNAMRDSKLFVHDMGADGLRTEDKQLADVIYEQVVTQTVLSGDVDDKAYKQRLAKAETNYSRILTVLVDAIHARPAPTTSALR